MGVYIKGVEMPDNCTDCWFRKTARHEYLSDCQLCPFTGDTTPYLTRDKKCPIGYVPPHGRLIDEQWLKDAMITTLEALKKNPKMGKQEMHLIAAFDTLRVMVDDAPTIIPAEEGET